MTRSTSRLLVPLTGTPESEVCLPLAAKLARSMDAEVVLMHVTQLPETGVQAEDARKAAQDALNRASQKLNGSVRMRIEESGDPVRGILHAISEEKPDMVIMATHGRTGIQAFAQGSIAYDVITAGTAPVTLVHTPSSD